MDYFRCNACRRKVINVDARGRCSRCAKKPNGEPAQ